MTSDFGAGSPYVAAMKAVVLSGCPQARLVDVSHTVPPFDVRGGSFVLWTGAAGFPPGSVHLAVVDPGVGGARRRMALETAGRFFVGPDNGLFTDVVRRLGGGRCRTVEIEPPVHASATFEGRDVFAPAAAQLALGRALEEVGTAAADPVLLDPAGAVIWVDGFGNLVTDLDPGPGGVKVGGRIVKRGARTFSEAPAGEPFWYVGSMGLLEIGVREARADRLLGAGPGTPVERLPAP